MPFKRVILSDRLCKNSEMFQAVGQTNHTDNRINDLVPQVRFVHASKWDNMSIILVRRIVFTQSDDQRGPAIPLHILRPGTSSSDALNRLNG